MQRWAAVELPVRDGVEQQSVAENCSGAPIQIGRKFKILDQVMSLLLNSFTCSSLNGLVPELFWTKQCGVFLIQRSQQ